jgi:hypothetical protein
MKRPIHLVGEDDAGPRDDTAPWNLDWLPYVLPAERSIPQRDFLLGKHYKRRSVSATIAGGGRLKTTISLIEAVSMAIGRDLMTGQELERGPLRALVLNAEEEQDELDRRVAAVCRQYGVSSVDWGDRLCVQSVRDNAPKFAVLTEKGRPTINRQAYTTLTDILRIGKVDVLMLDPLVSFHRVGESNPEHIDLLVKDVFNSIANRRDCAIELFHHTSKSKQGQIESQVEDSRGASSLIWAVRSARVINFMTPTEAKQFGIEDETERRKHLRVSNGKANMGPTGTAHWLKIETHALLNGDVVACATPWQPVNPFDEITKADLMACLAAAQGVAHRADTQAKNWFGYAVADVLKIPRQPNGKLAVHDRAKIKHIINKWLENKVFAVRKGIDAKRMERDFIVPGSLPVVDEPTLAGVVNV